MNQTEKFLFDCHGFIHIRGFLSKSETTALQKACLRLEQHALSCEDRTPRFVAPACGFEFWQGEGFGYFATRANTTPDSGTLLIDDFWLFEDGFDRLVGHEPTMAYVRELIKNKSYRTTGPDGMLINNAELRIRYKGNSSAAHMGYPRNSSRRFNYHVGVDGECNAGMVRMVYFLHDVDVHQGPICFIPGSHKSCFEVPVEPGTRVEDEPGMVPVPVREGDAVLFTEACRHGGFINQSEQTRYSLHVGYAPDLISSHNLSSQDGPMNVTDALLGRLRPEQRALLVRPGLQPVDQQK
jgi:hypothetical protein